MKDGIDTEYLVELICQVRCKNNGINAHINKKGFLNLDGVMIGDTHLSFDYLREKSNMIDALLHSIQMDILLKSGRLRKLQN